MERSTSARCKLPHLLSWHAHQIAHSLLESPQAIVLSSQDPVIARVPEGDLMITVQVAPVNAADNLPQRLPGRWLSSQEQLIWQVLADKPLIGKQVAAKLGWEYSTKLKFLLSNLEDRGVLLHDETEGYSRATLAGG